MGVALTANFVLFCYVPKEKKKNYHLIDVPLSQDSFNLVLSWIFALVSETVSSLKPSKLRQMIK